MQAPATPMDLAGGQILMHPPASSSTPTGPGTLLDGDTSPKDVSLCVDLEDAKMSLPRPTIDSILEDCSKQLDIFGCPCQYLEQVDLAEFGAWLSDEIPESDQFMYFYKPELPDVKEDETSTTPPLIVHVASLGVRRQCSLRPPTGQSHSLDLIEHILLSFKPQCLLVVQCQSVGKTMYLLQVCVRSAWHT